MGEHEGGPRPAEGPRPGKRAFSRQKPAVVISIANAVTIKEDEPFFLAQPDGDVPDGPGYGYGLYFRDGRFLDCFQLRLNGQPPTALMASAGEGFAAVHDLSNPTLVAPDGTTIPELTLGIRVERMLVAPNGENEGRNDDENEGGNEAVHTATLQQTLAIQNFAEREVEVTLSFAFDSHFLAVFEVRGLVSPVRHVVRREVLGDATVRLADHGADGLWRSTSLSFLPRPDALTERDATYRLTLRPTERRELGVSVVAAIAPELAPHHQTPPEKAWLASMRQRLRGERGAWLADQTRVTTANQLFDQVLDRALLDLRMLRTRLDEDEYLGAGLPWFGTLFGRDSVITALQTLAYDYTIAEKTLRILARFQGTRVDPSRDEEPGKILHELRVGELARARKIPSPYYGSVDSTPLFLILVAEHYAWSGDLRLFREIRPQVEAALRWVDVYGDHDHDGFLDYGSPGEHGYLVNQGWKDSGDAIMNADGSLAVPPIALVEVQGYVYRAKLGLAKVYAADGDAAAAARLRREAEQLERRFNERFWLPDRGIYALALQKDGRPAAVMSSNPGQALWGGIVAAERGGAVVGRLMDDAMYNGWGIRTLSAKERRYNPIDYHLGTVWPHDNSLIAAGMRAYGFDADARRVFVGMFEAAPTFVHARLPELFAGFSRGDFGVPAHYPVACHPQAWAAGAIPYLLHTALGLGPDAATGTLRLVRPDLPPFLEWVELRGLRVGDETVDLRFARESGRTRVDVVKRTGSLRVNVEGETKR